MKKDYLDKDFFISEDGKDDFEGQNPEKVKHLCVTDDAKELEKINESDPHKGAEMLVEIVVGLGDHIPLWQKGKTLRWRLHPMFNHYQNAEGVKNYIRGIMGAAIHSWGDASPVSFLETTGPVDFEVIMRPDNCNAYGCTLASAFFPNSNLNVLTLHPKMFQQSKNEQIETLIHEIGHIFGLRHYFAKEKEASWRSEVFGHHYPLTIMNYGHQSTLTEQDRIDLKALYTQVWSGQLTHINNMPIRLYRPLTDV